jgi:hypothetical protein
MSSVWPRLDLFYLSLTGYLPQTEFVFDDDEDAMLSPSSRDLQRTHEAREMADCWKRYILAKRMMMMMVVMTVVVKVVDGLLVVVVGPVPVEILWTLFVVAVERAM